MIIFESIPYVCARPDEIILDTNNPEGTPC